MPYHDRAIHGYHDWASQPHSETALPLRPSPGLATLPLIATSPLLRDPVDMGRLERVSHGGTGVWCEKNMVILGRVCPGRTVVWLDENVVSFVDHVNVKF